MNRLYRVIEFMCPENQAPKPMDDDNQEVDFHGAAVIDENGREIPITEEMIQKACAELDESEQNDQA